MKKCKNCKINDARYICIECNKEFCTFCMKEDEFSCSQCRHNNQEKKQKQQDQQQEENQFELQKKYSNISNIINIIIASSVLFFGIILVLTSYPSILDMSSISSIGDNISEEKINNINNDRGGFIYIFPFPLAIPIEFSTSFIIPLVLIFIIIIPIILFIIILKLIKIL